MVFFWGSILLSLTYVKCGNILSHESQSSLRGHEIVAFVKRIS